MGGFSCFGPGLVQILISVVVDQVQYSYLTMLWTRYSTVLCFVVVVVVEVPM
jgi:hypothetical protein